MERTILSEEDKIKRAIEISQRRNNNTYTQRIPVGKENNKKIEINLFKRMIIQAIICALIYTIFYLINTTNYIFSEEFIKKSNNILNYDLNINQIINNSREYINELIQKYNSYTAENTIESIEKTASHSSKKISDKILNNTESKIKELSQMEIDAEEVKKKCEFIKPIDGRITSEFGERESTSKIVSTDHKGIDIATKQGTEIKAAISGEVIEASQNSEYGKFVKILYEDVMTVYAHCKKLKTEKGKNIKKGDVIATVGSTGNSTGPHLHFEIRLSDRYINPRYVIDF